MRGSSLSHSPSASGAPSGGSNVAAFGPVRSSGGPSPRPRARLAARLAFRQRAATAWCARPYADHPSRKALLSSGGSAMARAARALPPAPSAGLGPARNPLFTGFSGGFLLFAGGEAGNDQEGVG